MIKYARIVLQDCKYAIAKHSIQMQAEEFRVSWISITLLRAVGHVLKEKDSQTSPVHKKVIDEKWDKLYATKPSPKILWKFIIKERNRFLKEYEHNISRDGHLGINPSGNNSILLSFDMANSRGNTVSSDKLQIKSVLSSGEYKNQNEKDVAWMAYNWWDNYLNEIDSLISEQENTETK